MSEATKDAMLLISISWQALNRALVSPSNTQICDNTVVLLFACIFIEANLNSIFLQLNIENNMTSFYKKEFPGLQNKLAWFYNEFIARKRVSNQKDLFRNDIKRKIRRSFPGFAELYNFRNDLSHGKVNKISKDLSKTKILRQSAKDIVDELYSIVQKRKGVILDRNITYEDAIS